MPAVVPSPFTRRPQGNCVIAEVDECPVVPLDKRHEIWRTKRWFVTPAQIAIRGNRSPRTGWTSCGAWWAHQGSNLGPDD
jgi:hypothetical protein